jgi:Spy/CpxP family protein refolding chaperone
MPWNKTVLSALLTGIILSASLAENATAQVPIRPRPSTVPGTMKPPRVEPCWEVAGVSKAAIQQRRMITQQARQQVEAVCANSSLSIQQKREQIQQMEALITPAQQEAIRSCQQGRNGGRGAAGHLGGGHGGPCGEMPLGHKPNPQHGEDETPPTETAKPN